MSRARFAIAGASWVFRYPSGAGQQLRLASEFLGYQIASWLKVPIPDFCLARRLGAFRPSASEAPTPAGLGLATRWIDGARYPDLEHQPLEPFWQDERYLIKTAAVRVADTWMMNYDRRKVGNVAVRGDAVAPEVYFLDFDQAFLAKQPILGRGRPHWISADFERTMLHDRELLSGFNGSGEVKSEAAQTREHFNSSIRQLRSIGAAEIEPAIRAIPAEWGIVESGRCVWMERLLDRRSIVLEILETYGAT